MSHRPYSLEDNPKVLYIVCKTPIAPLVCQKRFPKAFIATTIVYKDGYPEYRRRDDGRTFAVRKPGCLGQEVVRNNRWVVLYNLYLL